MSDDKKVIDFNAKRQKSIEQKRRTFERVMFQEFLGVYSVMDDQGTGYPVKLVDISKEGLQFQLPFSAKAKNQYKAGSEITLKLYFTKGSYLPALVTVRRAAEYIDERGDAWLRLGGEFDTTVPTFKAISTFVDFIIQYSELSSIDKTDSKVYFL
jgi:hypothetical protein